jgi:hypothetical protein
VLAAIALAHAWWAVGGIWPAADAATLARGVVGDGRTRMPSAGITALVALMLAVVAVWPLLLTGLLTVPLPRLIVLVIGAAMGVVFLVRGLAGYSSRWRRRFRVEPFATRDVLYFSPLCLVLAAGYAALVSQGVLS